MKFAKPRPVAAGGKDGRRGGHDDKLGQKAARGALVMVAGQGSRIVIQLASVVVLAKLLTPQDYGLVAMVLSLVGIGEIFRDFGLSTAAVQAETLSKAQRTNLFWLNTGIGATLSLIVFCSAGLIAAFFGEPLLTPIAQALSLTFLINGVATQYRADLNRHMKFGSLALSDVLAQGVALVAAVIFALLGAGYWALVAQQITQVTTVLVLVVCFGRWLPGLWRRKVPLKGFLKFGWNLMGTQLIGYASNNLDSIIIGLRFGASPLGIYNRGFSLLMSPLSQLRAPTTTVALPVLSRLQHDEERSGRYIKRGQIALGYSIVPGLAFVGGAAVPLVNLLLGDAWAEVAPILALLAVAGAFQTLSYVGYWVYLSRGLTSQLLRYTMVTFVIKAVCILGGSNWGIVGVAAGYALAPALCWPLSLWWLNRITVLPMRSLLLGALRIVSLAAVAGGAAFVTSWLLRAEPSVLALVAAGGAVLACYGVGALLFSRIREDIGAVLDTGRKMLRR